MSTSALAARALVDRHPHADVDQDVLPAAQRHLHLRHHVPQRRCPRSSSRAPEQLDHRRPRTPEAPLEERHADGRAPERLDVGVARRRGLRRRPGSARTPRAAGSVRTRRTARRRVTPLPRPCVSFPVGSDDLAADAEDAARVDAVKQHAASARARCPPARAASRSRCPASRTAPRSRTACGRRSGARRRTAGSRCGPRRADTGRRGPPRSPETPSR